MVALVTHIAWDNNGSTMCLTHIGKDNYGCSVLTHIDKDIYGSSVVIIE